jgi:hypothetical protein
MTTRIQDDALKSIGGLAAAALSMFESAEKSVQLVAIGRLAANIEQRSADQLAKQLRIEQLESATCEQDEAIAILETSLTFVAAERDEERGQAASLKTQLEAEKRGRQGDAAISAQQSSALEAANVDLKAKVAALPPAPAPVQPPTRQKESV